MTNEKLEVLKSQALMIADLAYQAGQNDQDEKRLAEIKVLRDKLNQGLKLMNKILGAERTLHPDHQWKGYRGEVLEKIRAFIVSA